MRFFINRSFITSIRRQSIPQNRLIRHERFQPHLGERRRHCPSKSTYYDRHYRQAPPLQPEQPEVVPACLPSESQQPSASATFCRVPPSQPAALACATCNDMHDEVSSSTQTILPCNSFSILNSTGYSSKEVNITLFSVDGIHETHDFNVWYGLWC